MEEENTEQFKEVLEMKIKDINELAKKHNMEFTIKKGKLIMIKKHPN